MTKPLCPCPIHCKYCGARRERDILGHYCPTKNCDWEFGFKCCTLHIKEPKPDHIEERDGVK